MMQGLNVQNWKDLRWPEDSYQYDEKKGLMAVADGITRDPKNLFILPNRNNLAGMMKFFWNYPGSKLKFWKREKSPAKIAADKFCTAFMSAMQTFDKKDARAVRYSFEKANEEIKILNEEHNPEPDYLENDYWGCVAAGCALRQEEGQKILSYGFIADCGIAVFNEGNGRKFMTPNEGPNSKGSIDADIKSKYKTGFKFPEGRKIIRSEYRNNPIQPLAYGALTGEENVMRYVRTGEIEIKKRDILIIHTDGLEEIVKSRELSEAIDLGYLNSMRIYCKQNVKSEGTMVYFIDREND